MADREGIDLGDAPGARAVNDFHTNSDQDTGPEAQHHTIGRGVHQSASGAHNHRDGNGAAILDGIVLTGTKSGTNSVLLTTIVSALVALGVEDNTT